MCFRLAYWFGILMISSELIVYADCWTCAFRFCGMLEVVRMSTTRYL